MHEAFEKEIENLRIVYNEIIMGYSYFRAQNSYIRHLTELDFGILAENKHSNFLKFKKEGLPTESERLSYLIDNDAWSKDKEEKILELRYIITDNEKSVVKIIPIQQPPILRIIEDTKKELNEIIRERETLIGATAEVYAEKSNSQYLIYLSFCRDETLKEKKFLSPSDLDNLEEDEIMDCLLFLSSIRSRITEQVIQNISVMPFFLNHFSYCKESVYHFLGKPVINLSNYQLSLFSYGSRNLNILSQTDGEPPGLLGDVPISDISNWFDQQYSVLIGKRNKK